MAELLSFSIKYRNSCSPDKSIADLFEKYGQIRGFVKNLNYTYTELSINSMAQVGSCSAGKKIPSFKEPEGYSPVFTESHH
jgi:hypothetical protein